MKKLLTILFLFGVLTSYSQTFYYPVVIKQTLRVDGKVAIGGVTFDRDFTVTADTIRIKSLDGSGNFLGIDVNGDVTRVTGVGAAGVTGLTPYELLIGDVTGIIHQTPNLQWSDASLLDILYISGTNPIIDMRDPANNFAANYTNQNVFLTDGSGAAMDIQYNMLKFVDDDNGSVSIFKKDDNSGTAYDLFLPPVNGTSGKSLRLNGSLELEWYTPATGTVTSIATTSPIGGGTITSTGTLNLLSSAADKYLYSTGVNTWTEGSITLAGRDLLDDADVVAQLATLGIPTASNEFLFGNGSGVSSSGDMTFDGTEFIIGSSRLKINVSSGYFTKYFNSTPTDGGLFIGNSGSGYWDNGTITGTDITVGYSSPNITLGIDYSAGQSASTSTKGFLTDTDWDTFNDKTGRVGTAVNLTGQNAAIGATTIYTTPATDGFYQINWVASITTAGTTSILGPFQVQYTNASDNVVKTYPTSSINFFNQTNANTTGAAVGGSFTVYCKASTDIKYIMGRTSAGTAMIYDLNIQIIKL